jgi:PIN domain nuclease of toxin-antitoxin system
VLLDTCTFLWLALDAPQLSAVARATFQDAGNEVFLSAASAWEIAIKERLGRLRVPAPVDAYVPRLRRELAIEMLPIEEEAALHTTRLPDLHRDPFDRMLVSQAIVHGMTLLTPDMLITQYPIRAMW